VMQFAAGEGLLIGAEDELQRVRTLSLLLERAYIGRGLNC